MSLSRYPARLLAGALLSLGAHASSLAAQAAPAAPRTNHVVLVVSSAGRDSGRTHPGFEMSELSQAWLIFTRNGFRVTIASPTGGAVEPDKFDRQSEHNAAFVADKEAISQLAATRRTASLDAAEFDALMVIGGKGAMFDLPRDTALARLAGALYDRGGVVSAVCHGPAGLLRARTRDGQLLLAGRAVTGYTNEEETVFGKQWRASFPFLLEDEARRIGARWEESPLMMPHVTVHDRLITGQNPFGTPGASEAVIRVLGRTPVARTPWKEEAAVYAAQELLTQEPSVARRNLAAQYKAVQVEILGLLGYYQLQAATTDADVQRATFLMELASPYMPAPELSLALASAYRRLGRPGDARALATDVAARHKAHEKEARALLATLPQ
jgi:putative intracellular protease/amidase